MSDRYGKERVKRGLVHFVLGKSVSSVAGFLAMLLVIRLLSMESFAAYSVLMAFVEILTAISGLGLAHVLLRYVPELYGLHYRVALRELVANAVALRTCVLLVAAVFAWLFSDRLTPFVGLANQLMAFKVFLLVVVLRSTTQFLSQVLESTLHQGVAQFAFSMAAVVRLAGMAYLTLSGEADLISTIWVEAASDSSGLLIVSLGVMQVLSKSVSGAATPNDDRRWLRNNLRQLSRFAAAGYLQHLAILPCGGDTNRLIGGHMLSVGALANFGFAQSLYEYVKRYLPAQLLVGLIRPIVVARYCENRDFSVAAKLCGQVLQINILLIGAAFSVLAVGGTEALGFLSSGKYGVEAAILLAALLFVLLLETQRQQLELLVQVVGEYRVLIPSNVLLSCSVLLAVGLLPLLGAISFPVANLSGLLVANAWVQHRMRVMGYRFPHDWLGSATVALVFFLTVFFGLGLNHLGIPWFISVLLSGALYGLLGFVFCGETMRSFANDLTKKKTESLPLPALPLVTCAPVIAFGILSSKRSASAVDQIANAVFPHPVYVHHDFNQQPDFTPKAGNIRVLPDPVATAWGNWSLVAASYRLMEASLADPTITHFQLLSEACLPIRSIASFEAFLVNEQPDIMIDILRLKENDALFSHGWRYFSGRRFDQRLTRRASLWIWGESKRYRQVCSVNLHLPDRSKSTRSTVLQKVGKLIVEVYSKAFDRALAKFGLKEAAIGGQWFGASRRAVVWLISARNELEGFTKHFERCHIPDEAYIQTLVLNAQLARLPLRIFPSNHATSWESSSAGPCLVSESDILKFQANGKFFARKFPLETEAAVRQQILCHFS